MHSENEIALECLGYQHYYGGRRFAYSMVAYRNWLYIFGGGDLDLIIFDKTSHTRFYKTTGRPGGPSSHVYRTTSGSYILGCSENDTGYLSMFEFNTKKWKKMKIKGEVQPADLCGKAAAVYGDQLWAFSVIFPANGTWSISLQGDAQEWKTVEQFGDCPTHIYDNTVAVAGDCMYTLGRVGEPMHIKLFRFSFKDRTWLCIKDIRCLKPTGNELAMVAHEDQLIILRPSKRYSELLYFCFNLNTRRLTFHKLISGVQCRSTVDYVFAAVSDNTLYFINGGCELFKLQLKPNNPNNSIALRNDFKKLLVSKLFCDVEFLVGEEQVKFPAHIAIVVARSDWLRDHILQLRDSQGPTYDPLKYSSILQVKLPNIKVPNIFQLVLTYIYTDEIKLANNVSLILGLYQIAEELRLKSLKHLLTQKLNGLTNLSNVLEVLTKGQKFLPVKEFCLRFITDDSNSNVILKSKEVETLDNALIVEILRRTKFPSDDSKVISSVDLISKTLEADMQEFLKSIGKKFCDIALKIGDVHIRAHKSILAARSGYFDAMFRSSTPLINFAPIQIKNVTSVEAFNSLLKYIYYGEINLPLEHLSRLIAAPFYYQFSDNELFIDFQQNLKEFGTFDNMVVALATADQAQDHDMKKYVLSLIVDRGPKIWPRSLPLSPELFMDVIDAFRLSAIKNDISIDP